MIPTGYTSSLKRRVLKKRKTDVRKRKRLISRSQVVECAVKLVAAKPSELRRTIRVRRYIVRSEAAHHELIENRARFRKKPLRATQQVGVNSTCHAHGEHQILGRHLTGIEIVGDPTILHPHPTLVVLRHGGGG